MARLRAAGGWLAVNIGEIVVGLLMALLCLAVVTGVASRAFARPVSWSEEVARYLYIWITFLGAALAVKRGAHFGLNLLTAGLGKRWAPAVEVITDASTVPFGTVLILYSQPLLELGGIQRGAAVNVPMSWVIAALPASGLLMALYALMRLWRMWTGRGAPLSWAQASSCGPPSRRSLSRWYSATDGGPRRLTWCCRSSSVHSWYWRYCVCPSRLRWASGRSWRSC